MISAAILRLKELVGFPTVWAQPALKTELDDWLKTLPVNRMQTSAEVWLQSHIDNMATFGRAHTEIVLNNARNDVFGLVEVHPTTVGLRPTFGGYATNVVQYQYGGGVPVTIIPELLLNSVNDIRGDDPNGTSMIAELPFVGQILNTILRSIGNTFDRFGSPTFWLNWEPPTTWQDPSGKLTNQILQTMGGNLNNALKSRTEGLANDFLTSGKTTVQILGAEGEQLDVEIPGRLIMEQICARFGLPPFMYGFSWSSTERMSTAQAKMVTEIIETLRDIVEPQIEKLINLRLLLTGRRASFSLEWPKVSLQDLIDVARADLMDSQAEQVNLANWDRRIRLGMNSIEEMAQEFREDLVNLSPEQVRKRLPDLVTELPALIPSPVGGESFSTGDEPGSSSSTPGGRPRTETEGGQRALVYNGNGNGRN